MSNQIVDKNLCISCLDNSYRSNLKNVGLNFCGEKGSLFFFPKKEIKMDRTFNKGYISGKLHNKHRNPKIITRPRMAR